MSNMKSLVTKDQISGNLRRTAKKGLISLLNKKELEKLAIKYYGETDEKGNLIKYYCPYSGEPLTDVDKIVLEHIIPITSNGGTVLFNCIPTSEEVNKSNEKGALHLLSWWTKKDYYSPEKLDKLLSYIFEAYDIVFKNNTIEQVKNSYDDIDLDEEENNKEADENTTSSNERQKLKEQAQITGTISYLGFINNCIDELKDKNYDTSKYEIKIKEYETKGIFKEVERYTLFQNILKETIKYKLDEDNRSELTYTLNINISKLMDSMKEYQTPEEITREILTRINNIEKILNENNIGLISFFEDSKNNDILYKKENKITPKDIDKLVNEINLSISDKFNKLCEFAEKNNGKLPTRAKEAKEQEKQLGSFRNNIKSIQTIKKNKNKFSTPLSKEQLQYLHNSNYETLKEIYKVILNNAIENNIEIEYVDEDMKTKIIEFHQKKVGLTIDEQIKLEQEYKDYIIIDSQFNEFIDYVLSNDGKLPIKNSDNEQEKRLGTFRDSIQHIEKNRNKFHTPLSEERLRYLHNSPYESLREIYKVILNRAIENNVEIEYVDENMKIKIIEFHQKKVGLTIKEQIKLEQMYKEYIIPDGQFNEFISFVLSNDGKLPTRAKEAKEQEKQLGQFRNSIQQIIKNKNKFHAPLSEERLRYLHNSPYESLREIYKVILNTAIKNNIKIEYVDEEMKAKIIEFHQKKIGLTIEEQIKLEQDYRDYIIPDSQFNKFISFVLNNEGRLPSETSKNEQEKQLGKFRNSIQQIIKNKNKFNTPLSEEQLMYLHDSKYENLREIYKVILNKAIENNVEIEYVDEQMKEKINDFNQKQVGLTIEEQIKLEQEHKDYIIIDSQFNEFIDYVLNNGGILPSSTAKEANEQEKRLGSFRNNIQQIKKDKNKFKTPLSMGQLEYLYNSEYVSLQGLYNTIMEKAYSVNYQEYIDIDNEIRNNNRKGRAA